MKNSIKNTLTLVLICGAVSAMLAVTNFITDPIIKRNENLRANSALLEIMPDAKDFEEIDLNTFELPATVTQAFKADNGGVVIKLTTNGYSSNMIIMCGVNADGTVSKAVCLSSSETLGYEKTFGENFSQKTAQQVEEVDTISGATKTTSAYRSAVKDALNAAIILGGGSVDIRSEEEILNDNLNTALPAAAGEFEKHFFVEKVAGVDAVYIAKNGLGYVCVIGEEFIAVNADGSLAVETAPEIGSTATAAIATINATTLTDINISNYSNLPSQLVSAKITASGNYLIEIKGAGYGIVGGDEYHPASGEYIYIRVSLTADGQVIDCETISQKETDGIGSACAEESFYGQFDGKTEENYTEIDAISGATMTTDGYTKAIKRAFETVKILEGGAK